MPAESAPFDLERILRTLDRHRVEYVLVGGLGARALGATRPTEDVDFVPHAIALRSSAHGCASRE